MKFIFIFILIFLNCAVVNAKDRTHSLSCSIGRVILAADSRNSIDLGNGNGSFFLISVINEEYTRVAKMDENDRVSFFWAIIFRIELDSGYSLEVLELIKKDCGPQFKRRLETFLKKSKALGIDDLHQKTANSFLSDLNKLSGISR